MYLRTFCRAPRTISRSNVIYLQSYHRYCRFNSNKKLQWVDETIGTPCFIIVLSTESTTFNQRNWKVILPFCCYHLLNHSPISIQNVFMLHCVVNSCIFIFVYAHHVGYKHNILKQHTHTCTRAHIENWNAAQ